MSKLYDKYKKETINELVTIYIKSCILKEYLHLFPIISKLELSNDIFITNQIEYYYTKYYADVSLYILPEEFRDICKQSIIQVNDSSKVYQTEIIDYLDNFPNTFQKYDTEITNTVSAIDNKKYVDNNIYIENYIRLKSVDVSAIDSDVYFRIFNDSSYKNVVNIKYFSLFLVDVLNPQRQINLDNFFNIFKDIQICSRVIVNPIVQYSNKKELFDKIIAKENAKLEKINAIRYKNENEDLYFFPVQLASVEYNIFNLVEKNVQSLYDFLSNENLQYIMNLVAKSFWSDNNFSKLFQYHVPIQILQPILFENIKDKYKLLGDVFNKNLPYNNLNKTIINLIDKIYNIEDDNRL